jgi:hypothetical protein
VVEVSVTARACRTTTEPAPASTTAPPDQQSRGRGGCQARGNNPIEPEASAEVELDPLRNDRGTLTATWVALPFCRPRGHDRHCRSGSRRTRSRSPWPSRIERRRVRWFVDAEASDRLGPDAALAEFGIPDLPRS